MSKFLNLVAFAFLGICLCLEVTRPALAEDTEGDGETYAIEEIAGLAEGFFGATTKGLATAIEKVFSELGQPNAYITGEEVSGSFVVGLRYGKGSLNRKGVAEKAVYWQGPSIGWDFGGNASKVFALVYGLDDTEKLFQRYPGVEGSFYFVGGLGVNYQRSDGVTIAPIRTGAGLRAGANVGYLHYGKEHSWLPF
ncbi:MAG: DUF1134 domain-containing protein [Magnetovibrionaceae bacterium]